MGSPAFWALLLFSPEVRPRFPIEAWRSTVAAPWHAVTQQRVSHSEKWQSLDPEKIFSKVLVKNKIVPDSTPSNPILCRISPCPNWFCAGLHLAIIQFVPDSTLQQTVLCRIVPPKLHKVSSFGVLLPKPNLSF